MKSTPRSRRHRNPHAHDEQGEQQSPFFTKANDVPVQQRQQPFFNTKAGAVQTKLAIGQPGDKYEQEADAVADAVVNRPAASPGVQQKGKGLQRATLASPEKDEKLSTAEGRMEEDKAIQEKPEEEEAVQKMDAPKEDEKPVQAKEKDKEPVQMKAQPEEEEPVQKMEAPKEEEPVQKQAAEEEEPVQKMEAPKEEEEPVQKMDAPKKDEEPVQKKGAPEEEEPVQAKKEEEEPIQKKAANNGPANAPISSRLKDSKGKGRPLSGKARQEMESGIGADFGGVRLHTDDEAVGMNEALRAQAFTNGKDVYFNKGKYNPESAEGKRLLAHELTHVVQQGGTNGDKTAPGRVQRELIQDGKKLDFEAAKGMVLTTQTGRLTETDLTILKELVNAKEPITVKNGEEIIKLLRDKYREKHNLTNGEVEELDSYQGGGYKNLNKTLRSGSVREKYNVTKQVDTLKSGSKKLPKTNGKVRRILTFKEKNDCIAFLNLMKTGQIYTALQFESTTRKAGELSLPDNHPHQVYLSIEAKGHHGAEISSAINTIKSEEETLFPPGTKFKVIQGPDMPKTDVDYSSENPFKTTVDIEELQDIPEHRLPTKDEANAELFKPLPAQKSASGGKKKDNLRESL